MLHAKTHTHTHTADEATSHWDAGRKANVQFSISFQCYTYTCVCVCVCGELLLYAAPLPLLEHIFGTIPKMVPLIFFFLISWTLHALRQAMPRKNVVKIVRGIFLKVIRSAVFWMRLKHARVLFHRVVDHLLTIYRVRYCFQEVHRRVGPVCWPKDPLTHCQIR